MSNYRSNIGGIADADDLFYNILINNNNTGYDENGVFNGTDISVPLIFDETRSNPYINRADDYYMSVISFQADTVDLPVFLCDMAPGATNIDTTNYYVSVEGPPPAPIIPSGYWNGLYTYGQAQLWLYQGFYYPCIANNTDSYLTPPSVSPDFDPAIVNKGIWSASTAYNPNDLVEYVGQNWYTTTAVGPTATPPTIDPAWTNLVDTIATARDWSILNNISYTLGDVWTYLGFNYICLVSNTSMITPDLDTVNWLVYVPPINIVQVNVLWSPEDLSAVVPPTPIPKDYNNYSYYYGYTYQHFISLVNNAITTAAVAAGATYSPFITMNDKGLFSITAENTEFNNGAGAELFRLFFNADLFYLFCGFNAIRQQEPYLSTGLYGLNYKILFVLNQSLNNLVPIPTDLTTVPPSVTYNAVVNAAEFSSLAVWNPICSVVFTVAYLPVVPELISAPIRFQNNVSNADTYYVLTDYSPPLVNGLEWKPSIYYQPLSEFRLVDLYGENAVNQLRIVVYWKDLFGALHPFMLDEGGTALVKIMFRKKRFYGENSEL